MKIIKLVLTEQRIFRGLLFFQLLAMLIMSQDAGSSADENRHYIQAKKVYNYYASKGKDTAALENSGIDPMQYNGQSFDNLMYVIEKVFDVEKRMEMRHFFNAFIGWLIILITGLTAKRIWGYKGAILAILLLFISPRFLGHAMNNNKDIPFALGFMLSFYGIIRFLEEMPKPSVKSILVLTLGIAIAISIRLAGLLSVAFLGFYSAILYFSTKPFLSLFEKNKFLILKKLLIWLPLIVTTGYFLGILFWPFMITDPFANIKVILDATSSHPVSLTQLFEGEMIQSDKIPKYYPLKYMAYTYPLVILIGFSLFFILVSFVIKKKDVFTYFIILFAFIFVLIWMGLKTTNFYGGIRHLLFVYPLAICIAIIGFKSLSELLQKKKSKWVQSIPYFLVAVLCINPTLHIVRNYPYSYIYFNEIIGGTKNAYGKYEMDYFQHSLRHATEWLVKNELSDLESGSSKVKIISNDYSNTKYYLRPVSDKTELKYTRYYDKYKQDWDYGIFYGTYISPNQIENKSWPPYGTIHTEVVDGVPIAAVVKRQSKDDFKGFEAINKNNTKQAKKYFYNYLRNHPPNEEAFQGLAMAYLMEQDYAESIKNADRSLFHNPRQQSTWIIKTDALIAQKKFEEALQASNELTKIKRGIAEGHFQKGVALKYLNKPNDALNEFSLAASYKNDYYQAFMQTGEIFMNYKNFEKAINIYNQVLEFKPNDMLAIANSAKCYHFLTQTTKAEELLNSVSEVDQRHLEVLKVKARIALEKKDLNEAARLLNMASFVDTDSELFVIRARFVSKQKNTELAKQFLNEAIELNQVNMEAKDLLESLEKELMSKK